MDKRGIEGRGGETNVCQYGEEKRLERKLQREKGKRERKRKEIEREKGNKERKLEGEEELM